MFATIVLYSVTLPSSYAELLLISSYLIMVTKLLFTFRPSGMLGLYFLFGGSIKIILHLNLLIWTILFFFLQHLVLPRVSNKLLFLVHKIVVLISSYPHIFTFLQLCYLLCGALLLGVPFLSGESSPCFVLCPHLGHVFSGAAELCHLWVCLHCSTSQWLTKPYIFLFLLFSLIFQVTS